MKKLQKFILPALILLGVFLIYTVYFSGSKGLGSFSDFDPNNNAVKDIRVLLVAERGITSNPGGGAVFFAEDKNKNIVQVNADKIPSGLETATTIILKGHLSQDSFHAHDVVID
jgi:hypothetical protein